MHAQLPKILLAGSLLFIGTLAYKCQSPPPVVSEDAPETEFSAMRAFQHLAQVAHAPHSGGTSEHARVRDYLVNYCRKMGLHVEIQDTLAVNAGRNYTVTSNVKNIIAMTPGGKADASILVVSHYDSQPNSLGASDDGAGVVAMLETIRALNERPALMNRVIFLFTDQEEVGLLGAEAFASLHPAIKQVKVVLNYESRGNSGVAYCFEVSDQNGWIVKQFAKAGAHPVANSMAYEIYKLMPNDTDFTIFRAHDITGLNQANVDGYVNYHSMTDTPENLDKRIIQHHGDNMLSMITHLGALDLDETKTPDVNFFNPVGSWMVYYPAYLNIPLMILAMLLFVWNVKSALDKRISNVKSILLGAVAYLTFLLFLTLAVTLLAKVLVAINPHFANFYSNNFYNINWYILSMVGLWLVMGSLIYRKLWSKIGSAGLTLGAVLTLLLIMIALHLYLPTATFVIYYPVCWFLLVLLIFNSRKGTFSWLTVVASLPAIGLWIPLGATLFIVFSLQMPQAGALMFGLLWCMFLPAFGRIEASKSSPILLIGALFLLVGLGWGQVKASYTKDQPLQSYLTYVLDQDTGKAAWVSTNQRKDLWTENYLSDPEKGPFTELYPQWQVWRGEAESVRIPAPRIQVQSDTLIASTRHVKLVIVPQRSIVGMELRFVKGMDIQSLVVNGREISNPTSTLVVHAIDEMLQLEMITNGEVVAFQLVERDLGLPQSMLTTPLPATHVFGPGSFSNALFTTQRVVL